MIDVDMIAKNKKKKTVVVVSGGFDPIHIGHVRLFEAARKLGDELVGILNNDNLLKKKKEKIFVVQRVSVSGFIRFT